MLMMFLLYFLLITFFEGYFFTVGVNASTEIDSSVSRAVKDSNKISMVINIFSDGRIETAQKNSFKRNTTDGWWNYGFFKHQPCDFGVDKENISKNSLIHLNQGNELHEDNKKVYYGDFFILGQVNEVLNLPEDVSTYKFKDREVKLFRPRYDSITGTFL